LEGVEENSVFKVAALNAWAEEFLAFHSERIGGWDFSGGYMSDSLGYSRVVDFLKAWGGGGKKRWEGFKGK
jgi:hypothetical protein